MSDHAIEIENLSKRYRIGLKDEMHDSILAWMLSWIKSPISNFRRVQKLSKFNDETPAPTMMAPESSSLLGSQIKSSLQFLVVSNLGVLKG